MTVTTDPDEPLVVGVTVLYGDDLDSGVIAHVPEVLGAISRGEDRRAARAAVRHVLRDVILGYLEPVDVLTDLVDVDALRLVIEP
jgi:hypothetical protein